MAAKHAGVFLALVRMLFRVPGGKSKLSLPATVTTCTSASRVDLGKRTENFPRS